LGAIDVFIDKQGQTNKLAEHKKNRKDVELCLKLLASRLKGFEFFFFF